jgi:hypothetical protein
MQPRFKMPADSEVLGSVPKMFLRLGWRACGLTSIEMMVMSGYYEFDDRVKIPALEECSKISKDFMLVMELIRGHLRCVVVIPP